MASKKIEPEKMKPNKVDIVLANRVLAKIDDYIMDLRGTLVSLNRRHAKVGGLGRDISEVRSELVAVKEARRLLIEIADPAILARIVIHDDVASLTKSVPVDARVFEVYRQRSALERGA